MANISKIPDAYGSGDLSYVPTPSFDGWYEDIWTDPRPPAIPVTCSNSAQLYAAYLLRMPSTGLTITACSIDVDIDVPTVTTPFTIRCDLFEGNDITDSSYIIGTQTASVTQAETVVHKKFSFSGLSASREFLSFRLSCETLGVAVHITRTVTVAATYTIPQLTLSVTPVTVYDMIASIGEYGNTLFARVGNLLGQNVHSFSVRYSGADVQVDEYGITSDPELFSVSAYGIFDMVGATGSSINVQLVVRDTLGRTATAAFTCKLPQGSTATTTAPKNTTLDGTLPIAFSWAMSSDWGAQKSATLRWSTDNATWKTLATISGAAQSWSAPKLKFPAGTIYWQVRCENTFGKVGPWSSSASFTVKYDAVSQVVPVNSQTSGTFQRTAAKTFQASLQASGQVYAPFTFASAVFHWRAGTSGTWTDVSMTLSASAQTAAVTIGANTFPAGEMQWYISATDNTGRSTQTPEYTLTAVTSAVDVLPVRPINTVESGDGEITFNWNFVSLDGLAPASGEWRWSSDGSEWTTTEITQIERADSYELVIPPDTFPAGTVYWQARARNRAGVWGDWSVMVSFRVLDAPTVEGVTGDGKPFLTVSWQTPTGSDYGQQAFKIMIDGKLYGPFFGADVRSYTLKEPLEDGAHEVKVAAQNRFGLWSEWATGNIVVENVPGPAFSVFAFVDPSFPAPLVAMIGATIAPIITRQPQDYQREADGNVVFMLSYKTWENFSPANPGFKTIRTWEYKAPNENEWHKINYSAPFMVSVPVTEANNGYQYRSLLSNAVGELYSDPATFYYREPRGFASDLREGEWKAPTGYFLIYRDGKLVGKTYENFFLDLPAVGSVSYEVLQVLPDGYYTRGAIVQGTVDAEVECPTLLSMDGSHTFLPLTLSEDPRRVQDIRHEAEVVYTQYEGAVYPEAEIGEHESLSASGDCAWTWEERDKAEAFRSYLKKPVIYKTPGGERVVGVLSGYTKKDAHFYMTARFSIQQMDWRDFADES